MRFTVADCVAANARAFGDRVALEVLHSRGAEGGATETLTYADVWSKASVMADAIGQVEPGANGPTVAILLPNGADHVLAYIAIMAAGAASVPVNSRLAGPEIDYVLSDSGASVIVSGHELLPVAQAAGLRCGCRVVDVAQLGFPGPDRWRGPTGDDRSAALALVAYTSGTTGFPKGATVSHEALLTRFAQWGWTFGLSPDRVLSIPGPLFHMSYGGLTLAHLVSGGRTRIMSAFEPSTALDEYAASFDLGLPRAVDVGDDRRSLG